MIKLTSKQKQAQDEDKIEFLLELEEQYLARQELAKLSLHGRLSKKDRYQAEEFVALQRFLIGKRDE